MACSTESERILHGTGVSAGLVVGFAYCARRAPKVSSDSHITAGDVTKEKARFLQAVEISRTQLKSAEDALLATLNADEPSSDMFESLLMMLEDPMLLMRVQEYVSDELFCAEAACQKAVEDICAELEQIEDDYLRERAKDIRNLGDRLIRNLMGVEADLNLQDAPEKCILVADDLTPSETAMLDPKRIIALVIAGGSRTSHTAILSKAIGIPAIVAVQEGLDDIATGDELALNGTTGEIWVKPSVQTHREFELKQLAEQALQNQLEAESHFPVETQDGYQACLVANVELPSEAISVRQRYNVGIGLFRTEFLFINGMSLFDEEAQFQAYKATAEAVRPHSVIFRTLDVGGDKLINQMKAPVEINPFMGVRAIRFSLRNPDMFRIQLRAILRASAFGKVRIMFPMISAYEELDQALKILDEVKLQLHSERIPFNDSLDVGCMIEVPSAAMLAEKLIKRLTFFSLGTNDLVQYSMAVDRSNASVGHLYQPAHPAIIRLIRDVVETAYSNGRWVSVCGEMAGDCLYTPLILGLGIHELSMSPVALGKIRMVIRNIKMHEAENLVKYAISCDRCSDVADACRAFVQKACPDVLG